MMTGAAAGSSAAGAPVIDIDGCSKWYGQVLGLSEVTWRGGGGIIGLLGPNGAGKSTLMKIMAGLLRPSRGRLTVFGHEPYRSPAVRARIGYCPEHEGMYNELSALEMVTAMAELSGYSPSAARTVAAEALARMGLSAAQDRRVQGFSKGMRQRTKLAQTIVHDPDLILLDEPLTGVDPVARNDIIRGVRAMAAQGKTIIVSSHVLYEVEALTEEILVIYRGQLLAEGNIYEIRGLIDQHPHRIRIDCAQPRRVGTRLAAAEHVERLSFDGDVLVVETRAPDACYDLIANAVLEESIDVRSLTSPDNNLSAVFEYLTSGKVGT